MGKEREQSRKERAPAFTASKIGINPGKISEQGSEKN